MEKGKGQRKQQRNSTRRSTSTSCGWKQSNCFRSTASVHKMGTTNAGLGILMSALILLSHDKPHHAHAFSFSASPSQRRAVATSLHATKPSLNDDGNFEFTSRREILSGLAIGTICASYLLPTEEAQAAPPVPLQTSSGSVVRVEEIGGGLDLLSPPTLSSSDVFYPSSMTDTKWKVQRVVTSVEGDLGQAALAWKLLGGSDERAFTSKLTEVYSAAFIEAPETMKDAYYNYEGKSLHAAVMDRGDELSSRMGLGKDVILWDVTNNNNATDYKRNNDTVNLTIVQRKIEPPSENGFGSDEVYRIQSSAGGIFAGANVYRAARVRRRYRRGFDESTGKRILDCIEIVTTHRVLDGIAGMELPTSTCKSRLRFTQI